MKTVLFFDHVAVAGRVVNTTLFFHVSFTPPMCRGVIGMLSGRFFSLLFGIAQIAGSQVSCPKHVLKV